MAKAKHSIFYDENVVNRNKKLKERYDKLIENCSIVYVYKDVEGHFTLIRTEIGEPDASYSYKMVPTRQVSNRV